MIIYNRYNNLYYFVDMSIFSFISVSVLFVCYFFFRQNFYTQLYRFRIVMCRLPFATNNLTRTAINVYSCELCNKVT